MRFLGYLSLFYLITFILEVKIEQTQNFSTYLRSLLKNHLRKPKKMKLQFRNHLYQVINQRDSGPFKTRSIKISSLLPLRFSIILNST